MPIIDDDVAEADETFTVVLSNAVNATVEISEAIGTITDDDERGVIVTPTALAVKEGDSGTYTVVLDTEPTDDVRVAVGVPQGAEVSVDETVLVFTAENWDQGADGGGERG